MLQWWYDLIYTSLYWCVHPRMMLVECTCILTQCYSSAHGIGRRCDYNVRNCLPQILSFTPLVGFQTTHLYFLLFFVLLHTPYFVPNYSFRPHLFVYTMFIFVSWNVQRGQLFIPEMLDQTMFVLHLLIIPFVGSTNTHSSLSVVDSMLITPGVGRTNGWNMLVKILLIKMCHKIKVHMLVVCTFCETSKCWECGTYCKMFNNIALFFSNMFQSLLSP